MGMKPWPFRPPSVGLKRLSAWWDSYKYRFTPWIVFNLKSELARQGGRLMPADDNVICSDEAYLQGLRELLSRFEKPDPQVVFRKSVMRQKHLGILHRHNRQVLWESQGFDLDVRPSSLPSAGSGVFVGRGRISRGAVAALYPGTVYEPGQPLLLQSLGNPFILRCSDGVALDGNHRGLSRVVFNSLHGRDRIGWMPACDPSWMDRCR